MITKINHWLRRLIALLLILLLAKVFVDTFWLLQAGPTEQVEVPEHFLRVESVQTTTQEPLSEERIAQWQLFGEKASEPAQEEEIKDAPDTRLNVELVGLFAHKNPQLAVAVIAEQGKDATLYRVGDSLNNNVEVVEIHTDRVILRRQGKYEALRMKEAQLSNKSGNTTMKGVEVSEVERRPQQAKRQRPAAKQQNSAAVMVPGDTPEEQREVIIKELALTPVSESSAQGYKIGEGAPAALIGAVGLRVGDEIVAVNGQALGEEQQDIAVLNDVLVSGRATIEVVRGSRRFTVNYPP